jgi:hypothetical protein
VRQVRKRVSCSSRTLVANRRSGASAAAAAAAEAEAEGIEMQEMGAGKGGAATATASSAEQMRVPPPPSLEEVLSEVRVSRRSSAANYATVGTTAREGSAVKTFGKLNHPLKPVQG